MSIEIGAWVMVPVSMLDLAAVHDAFAFPNPARAQAEARGVSAKRLREIPETLEFYQHDGDLVSLPRSSAWTRFLRRSPARVFDRRREGDAVVFPKEVVLYPWQREAADALVERDGLLVAPCGSGKTVLLLEAIRRLGKRAVVLTHSKDLLEQWKSRAVEHLGLDADQIGTIAGGTCDWRWKPLVVGTIQTIRNGVPPEFAESVGTVVVDEVHHGAAATWVKAITQFPARHRIGATATPERADGFSFVIRWHLGDVVATMDPPKVTPRVFVVRTGLEVPDRVAYIQHGRAAGNPSWASMATFLSREPSRNRIASEAILAAVNRSRKVLVLVDRVRHALDLGRALRDRGVDFAIRVGALSKRDRPAADGLEVTTSAAKPDALRTAMARRVVIATASLAKEGLDEPSLDFLLDVGMYGDEARATQSAGRISRRLDGKPVPELVLFEDDHDLARALVGKRLRTYRAMGCEIRKGMPP